MNCKQCEVGMGKITSVDPDICSACANKYNYTMTRTLKNGVGLEEIRLSAQILPILHIKEGEWKVISPPLDPAMITFGPMVHYPATNRKGNE